MVALKRFKPRVLCALLLATLLVVTGCIAQSAPLPREPEQPSRLLSVHFIDVGQGDSILIQFPEPASGVMLIDAADANAGNKVVSYIQSLGIEHIAWLIATHPHADHIGGIPEVLEHFSIGQVFMPRTSHTTRTYENLLLAIKQKSLRIDTASAGTSIFEQDGLSAMFVAPNSSSYRNLNDWSAVVRIEFLHTSFLFCGDAETESEQEMLALAGALLNADVLKVAHHGSNTSSSRAFLEAVSPSYAVIQVGAENSYGHPSERTLERLADIGAEVFRTDLCGTVVIVSDGTTVEVLRVEHP